MRFVIYIMALAALIFMGVTIFQVIVKRMTNRDLVRRKEYQDMQEQVERDRALVTELENYCNNAVIVNDSDITALNVLNIIHKKENA
jgi:hypothetical protein